MIKSQNIKFLMFPTLKYKNKLSWCGTGSNLSLVITAPNQQIHLETSPIEEHGALTHKLQDPVSYAWCQNWTSAQRKFDLKSHFQPDKLKRAFIWEKRWSLCPSQRLSTPRPCIDFPTLTELTRLSESKFLSMEKTLHCYEGEPSIEKVEQAHPSCRADFLFLK